MDFTQYEALSFDCYGTLIDWESGILAALHPVLARHKVSVSDRQLLEIYARIEAQAEAGAYIKYRAILREVVRQLGTRLGFVPTSSEIDALADSLPQWPPFPDTVEALQRLKEHFRLAIISNIDDDLFAQSAKHLKVAFDWIITAEQAKSYKPARHNFQLAMQRMGLSPDKILHVAQSIYHDVIPAKALGLATVWVNRRKDREGSGATPDAQGQPDLEVPDLKTLVSEMQWE